MAVATPTTAPDGLVHAIFAPATHLPPLVIGTGIAPRRGPRDPERSATQHQMPRFASPPCAPRTAPGGGIRAREVERGSGRRRFASGEDHCDERLFMLQCSDTVVAPGRYATPTSTP